MASSNRNIVTGIDVGTHSVRAVIAEWNGEEKTPRILGMGIAESHGLRHGYIVNGGDAVRSISSAVAKAEKAAGVKVRRAFVSSAGVGLEGFTGYGAAMVSRADGEVSDMDVEKAISMSESTVPGIQNKKVIYLIPLAYRLDGKEVLGKPQGMRGVKLEVKTLFITSLAQHVNDLLSAVEEAGIEVEDVFPAPIAASFVTLTRQQKTAGCLLANIGAETCSIVVFENNIPISLKVFPIGSSDITNDVALGLKISLEEAEDIKTGRAGDPPGGRRRLDDIMNARLSDIFELVDAHLKKIDRSGLLPAGIVITGGGSGIEAITDFAKNTLKIPSRIGYPSFGVPTNSAGTQQKQHSEVRSVPSWTVAYGLCVMGLSAGREAPTWRHTAKGMKRKIADFVKQFLP